jgi:lysophospholipid acyltransferase (LPLAT)-like uncharacterized protein
VATQSTAVISEKQTKRFTFRQRFVLWLISWCGYLAIRLIGPTLRYQVSYEEGGPTREDVYPGIYVFWHRCVFPSGYRYRNLKVAVMTSRSFDGEYIARIIEKLGFRAVRGSSKRGGAAGLLAMHSELEAGRIVAFTIDGPRGPRYVAKPGPVLLARNTQIPITAFYLAVERAWVLKTWDAFVIPKPFSRIQVRQSTTIRVPPDASLDEYQAIMQAALERVTEYAESQFSLETSKRTESVTT